MTHRERPILFSAPMVRAILEGRKTQTRRVVKLQPPAEARSAGVITSSTDPCNEGAWWWLDSPDLMEAGVVGDEFRCPYGQPGDRLWVRETWREIGARGESDGADYLATYVQESVAGGIPREHAIEMEAIERWRPSIHMPRWASRITLVVTDVRVERLQEISREDEIAEGTPDGMFFDCLWSSINGADSWAANPWVWVVSFRRVKP